MVVGEGVVVPGADACEVVEGGGPAAGVGDEVVDLEAVARCHLALCASGTATLEVGLVGTPMIVVYKVSALTSLRIEKPSQINHFVWAPAHFTWSDGRVLHGFVLRSPEPLKPYARCIGEWLEHWAR